MPDRASTESRNMPDDTYDTVVIGAGTAGTRAARELTDRGLRVVLLEAADRVGGRTMARPFSGYPGVDVIVDYGGSWINRSIQPFMRREIARYAIPVKDDQPATNAAFFTGGQRRLLPVPTEELGDLERALHLVRDASKRIMPNQPLSTQPIRDLDVTPDVFFAGLDLPPATRDLVLSMIGAYSGASGHNVSMLSIIAQVTNYGYSPIGFVNALTERFVGGVDGLLRAMIEGSRLEVRLQHKVSHVTQTDDTVTVRTEGGVTVDARSCVVAVPTNVIRHIEFTPGLSPAKQAGTATNHLSRATKTIMLVSDLHDRPFALGTGSFQMIAHAYDLGDGRHILYGFGGQQVGDLDPYDRDSVERALHQYLPHVEVLAVDAYDWNADPLFDGTYRVDPAGESYDFLRAMSQPEGAIVFAGTDVDDSGWRTWMEGSFNSAQYAADTIMGILARRH